MGTAHAPTMPYPILESRPATETPVAKSGRVITLGVVSTEFNHFLWGMYKRAALCGVFVSQ